MDTLVDLVNANKYHRVDSNILETPSILSDLAVVSMAKIVFDHPSNWPVFSMDSGKGNPTPLKGVMLLFTSVCSPW